MATLHQQRYIALSDELIDRKWLDADNPAAPAFQLDYLPPTGALPFFRDTATQAERNKVNNLIAGWDWGDSPADRLERTQIPERVLAAVVMRLSASWDTMTGAEKNQVQQLIDQGGAKLLTILRGA